MLKHVIVERILPGREDDFAACGIELRLLMHRRGWRPYTAWRAVAGDDGEPAMFDIGILGRAVQLDGTAVGFDCTFESRDELQAQLDAMRSDPDVVRVLLRAMDMVDRTASRAYILEDWWPPIPPEMEALAELAKDATA